MQKTVTKLLNIFKLNIDKHRIYGLDILRAFAIVAVMTGHGADLLSPKLKTNIFLIIPDGVSIFFVLSGFLIGRIIIKLLEKNNPIFKDLISFWKRRWLRTLPLYYAILLLLMSLSYLFIERFNIQETLQFFIFCQNFYKSNSSFFTVSWSLSIEEWFYLLTPPLFLMCTGLFKMKPNNAILFTAIFIILSSAGYRYYRYLTIFVDNPDTFDTLFRRPVLTRLDSLMFGVLGAHLYHYNKSFWIRYKNSFFAAGLLMHFSIKISTALFLSKSVFYYCNISFIAEAIATVMLLPFLSMLAAGKGNLYKVITYISLTSYSLYLLHAQIVLNWILKIIPKFGLQSYSLVVYEYLLYWTVSITISILSYKYVEIYFLKLRK